MVCHRLTLKYLVLQIVPQNMVLNKEKNKTSEKIRNFKLKNQKWLKQKTKENKRKSNNNNKKRVTLSIEKAIAYLVVNIEIDL